MTKKKSAHFSRKQEKSCYFQPHEKLTHFFQPFLEIIRGHKLHQLLDRKLALTIPLDHFGHVFGWMGLSLDGSEVLLAGHHPLERVDFIQVEIERRGSDLDVFAMVARKLHAGVHQHGGAGGVDGDVGADAVGQFFDGITEGFAFVELRAVDNVRCAEFLGKFETGFDLVDADDGATTGDFGAHHRAETDAAEA